MLPTAPSPVYATNLPIAELKTAELFTVSSLRLWAAPHRDPGSVHPDWRRGFEIAGMDDEAVQAFDALFTAVANAALRSLDVRCARCAKLGEDEGRLLQLVSLLQRHRRELAAALLGEWLAPGAARLAIVPAQSFASALATNGLVVPLRHSEAATVERIYPVTQADPGHRLLH